MKFGIIGAGMIARFHAEAIRRTPNADLHAIYARRPEVAAAFAAEFECKAYSDLDALLGDRAIDIVTIATPSGAHLEPTIAAARAGKHILCEKPIEVTVERVDEMIAECESAGVVLAGIFNRRFHPTVEVTKAALEAGRFGRLALCEAAVRWYRDQSYYDSGAWRGTWELDGGGALMNQAVHAIDQLLYLAGPIRCVQASTSRLAHERIEVEDTAVALLEFESGALGTIQGSTACWSATGNPAEITLAGSAGTVMLADERFRRWEFRHPNPEMDRKAAEFSGAAPPGMGANDPRAIDADGHARNFADVVSAIREGRRPAIDGREARRAVSLVCAIYESAETESKVFL